MFDLDPQARTPGVVLTWAIPMSGALVWVDASDGRVRSVGADPQAGFTVIEDSPSTVDTESLTLTVRSDDSGRFRATSPCLGDTPTCPDILARLAFVDTFFRDALGRDGWSDSGGGGIEADAPFTIIYNAGARRPAFTGGAVFSRRGVPRLTTGVRLRSGATPPGVVTILEDLDLSPVMVAAPGWDSEEILVHEFGHGVLDVDTDAGASEWQMFCERERMGESVADTFEIFEAAFYLRPLDEQLVALGGGGGLLRDHRFGDPPPPGAMLGDCAGRRHYTQYEPEPLSGSGRMCEQHGNSCILTKIWALGREADETGTPMSYHGVTVDPVSFLEGKRLFHDLVRAGLNLGDGYLDYGYDYLEAVARRIIACAVGTPCPPGLARSLTAPLYAVGLWSPPQALGVSTGVDTLVGPAVANRPGSVWIFHVPPGTGDLVHVYRDTDVLDGAPGASVVLSDLGVGLPPTTTDLAAARTDELVDLVVVPRGGGSVRVASTTSRTDASWLSTTQEVIIAGVREGLGSVSVGHFGLLSIPPTSDVATIVVAERSTGGSTELVYFLKGSTSATPVPGSMGESSPALSSDGLWSVFQGDLRRRTFTVFFTGDVVFSTPFLLPVPPRGEIDGNRSAERDRGLTVERFQGRTQIYLTRTLLGDVVHRAFGSALVEHPVILDDARWGRRPAAFNVTAPGGEPAQVLLTVGQSSLMFPNRLFLRQRRSD